MHRIYVDAKVEAFCLAINIKVNYENSMLKSFSSWINMHRESALGQTMYPSN